MNDPLELGLRIAQAFESQGVSYAIGGALAYGLWGIPRATMDIDINVFVGEEELGPVVDALLELGCEIDTERARADTARQGLFQTHLEDVRVDIFPSTIDFCDEAERCRARHSIDNREAWFLSAESIAVFKAMFFRAKDIVDLERLVAVQGGDLDQAYVRRHLVEMMGEDDERVTRWDEITGAR